MREPFRIRHARPIVISLTLGILGIFSAVALVRYTRATESKLTYVIQAEQTQLRGLRKAMDVKILGEPVGVVTDVRYHDDHPSNVEVLFTVKESQRNKIFANSRVIVARTMAVGTAYLEIERTSDMLGMVVRNLSNDEKNQLGTRGVKVVEIAESSPSSLYETRLLDSVVTSINDSPVENIRSYYQLMSAIVPGEVATLTIHDDDEKLSLGASMVTSHRTLTDGSVVQQFEPEESSFQSITDKLSMVQESIAKVEQSMVETMTSSNSKVDKTVLPAFESITSTSNAIRTGTLAKVDSTLDKSNQTLNRLDETVDTIKSQANQVSEKVIAAIDESAIPAFNQFNTAAKSLEQTSLEMRSTVDTVGNDTGAALEKLTEAIKQLQEVLDQSRGVLSQSQEVVTVLRREAQDLPGTAKRLNGTMQSIENTAQKAQTTIDGVNNHWLLKRSIQRSQQKKSGQSSSGPIRKLFGR